MKLRIHGWVVKSSPCEKWAVKRSDLRHRQSIETHVISCLVVVVWNIFIEYSYQSDLHVCVDTCKLLLSMIHFVLFQFYLILLHVCICCAYDTQVAFTLSINRFHMYVSERVFYDNINDIKSCKHCTELLKWSATYFVCLLMNSSDIFKDNTFLLLSAVKTMT